MRGDRGVTYDGPMPDNTTLTAGEWWPDDYGGPPLISFAAEEAAEMGLELGDTLTVNILGRDITGTIASFREVTWEDAGIGFVLTMNQSALAAAPHSWISTVYSEADAEAAILRDLASAYPNITAIRIRDAIAQVSELVEGIAAATRYGALATLLTGFLVLIGAAAAGEQARTFEGEQQQCHLAPPGQAEAVGELLEPLGRVEDRVLDLDRGQVLLEAQVHEAEAVAAPAG